MALEAAATLGAAGCPAQGLRMLDHYQQVEKNATPAEIGMPMLHEWVLARQGYWPNEIAHLRGQLNLDAKTNKTSAAPLNTDQSTTL